MAILDVLVNPRPPTTTQVRVEVIGSEAIVVSGQDLVFDANVGSATVSVQGADDDVIDGVQTYKVMASYLSGDACLAGASAQASMSNSDNDYRFYFTGLTAPGETFAGVVGADGLCATYQPFELSGFQFKALIVDGYSRRATDTPNAYSNPVDWVLQPHSTYFSYEDGTDRRVFRTNATPLVRFDLNESLESTFSPAGNLQFWTGLDTTWTTAFATCETWNNPDAMGAVGNPLTTGPTAFGGESVPCSFGYALMCVQQP